MNGTFEGIQFFVHMVLGACSDQGYVEFKVLNCVFGLVPTYVLHLLLKRLKSL